MLLIAFAFGVLLLALAGGPAPASAFTAEPAPDLDALFQRSEGWIGADGDYSVPLGDGRTLWLFSDTFVGTVRDGKRAGAAMINNSVAIQEGAQVSFHHGRTQDGSPQAFIRPGDGRGYYWLFAGVRTPEALFHFLMRVESTGGGGAFGFRGFGVRLAEVANPDDAPGRWLVREHEFPFADYGEAGSIFFGSAILRAGRCIYIYGQDGRKRASGGPCGMVVARVDEEDFGRFEAWRFLKGDAWQEDFRQSTVVCPDTPTEYSVTWQPLLKRYVAVYTEGGISGLIAMRESATPEGPWSEAVRLYECPDRQWHKGAFAYAAKAHPELAASGELVISYAANSNTFADLIEDARLYWPRFIRVKLAQPSGLAMGRDSESRPIEGR